MLKSILTAGAAALAVTGGAVLASGTALAAPSTVTAVTQVSNRPDGGHGTPSTWAYDDFTRTLTVTVASVQNPADTTAGLTDYTATITDHGQFHAVLGAGTPNQSGVFAGAHIVHGVSGAMNGTYSLTVTAPSADTLTGTVPATEDDNFGAPAVTTANWPKQAFATATGVSVAGGSYSWTYTRACESWTDASGTDGNAPADGNITGKLCVPPPHVYDVDVRQGRHGTETVTWRQTSPSADTVTLNGPGYHHAVFSVSPGADRLVLPRLRDRSWYSVTVQAAGGDSATTWLRTRR
jgi:hypothetical protein